MSEKPIIELRRRLESELAELRSRHFEVTNELHFAMASRERDRLDQSAVNESRENFSRQKHQIERAIARHVKALEAWDDYGFCEGCGEDIPLKRLQYDPTIRTCLICQEHREARAQRMAS